jgi:hypothetical protein
MRILASNTRWAVLLLLALLALGSWGCASTESENMSERPWDTPQTWETGLPSGMMNQQR